MPSEFADLEINVRRRATDQFTVELRASAPDSDAEIRVSSQTPEGARFDWNALRQHVLEPEVYGRLLTETVFTATALQNAFLQEFAKAQARDLALRVRLAIDPTAPELHNLRWETLLIPGGDASLLTNERIVFSRYLSSQDARPVRPRARAELNAVVVISSPTDVTQSVVDGAALEALDVPAQVARAQAAFAGMQVQTLASGGSATLEGIMERMRAGCDILYLVCHGALSDGEPQLWLETETGAADVVWGKDFVARVSELTQVPLLIVLASCQSAGTGKVNLDAQRGALAALGPRLAEAGVPAVVAMQGNVSVQTADAFMSKFFQELARHGQIDRAMAVARGSVRGQADHWMPALFMRLKSGLLWYTPGFADDPHFKKWPAVINNIHRNLEQDEEGEVQVGCTPILGHGLLEPFFGGERTIARRWAEEHGFPLSEDAREDLPQVAQYLSRHQDESFPREEMRRQMRLEIQKRFANELPPELRAPDVTLLALTNAIGKTLRARDENEPHRVLAQIPFHIYVSTNPDDMLSDALREQGRTPQIAICPWNRELEAKRDLYELPADYRPTVANPLVYHLFGRFKYPPSVVLTEDNYFDYLIGMTSNKTRIPSFVRSALANSALLFLGFQLDEWNFRVLFRSIINREGAPMLDQYTHVAVQLDPDETRNSNPTQARAYLERYFRNPDLSVYWGGVSDFTRQLREQWTARLKRDVVPGVGEMTSTTSMDYVMHQLRGVMKEPTG